MIVHLFHRKPRARHSPTGRLLLATAMWLAPIGCDTESPQSAANSETKSMSQAEDSVPASVISFEDITTQTGVNFISQNGRSSGFYTIVESLGTGIGITDLDGDRQLDIIAPGGGVFDEKANPTGAPSGTFRQNCLLKFEDITAVCGIDTQAYYTHGVAIGDWNNDGFPDVVITGFQTIRMFENCGDGTFNDVTLSMNIPQTSWATSAAFLDADNDGDLELYVVNYVHWQPDPKRRCFVGGHRNICAPGQFEAQSDYLFQNNGDGSFDDISTTSGLEEGGKGLAVIGADIDMDGDTDIYVANDTTANMFYVNDGTGKFAEQALISGCAMGATMEAEGSMGVDVTDFNLDGWPDVWVSNYENQSFAMYESRAPGIFQHVSTMTGISSVGRLYVGFGTFALDAELDGDDDIFAANGHVMYESHSEPVRQLPLVFENLNGKRFRNVADSIGPYGASLHMGRGLAVGDFNHDGLHDLVIAHSNAPMAILKNTSPPARNFVSVKLIGTSSSRDAIGARARIQGRCRLIKSGGSYLSDSQKILTWAVEPGQTTIDVEISWPNGVSKVWKVALNRMNCIVEGGPNLRE